MDEIICDCKAFFGIDDIEEELSCAEFVRIVQCLPAYKGAVRSRIESYVREHEEEFTEQSEDTKMPARTLTPEQLKTDPKLGAAPSAGQMAPIFDIREL